MRKISILILFIGFLITGCANVQNALNPTPAKFVPKTEKFGNYTFAVPANFKLKDEATLMYKSGSNIRAYLVYSGTGTIGKIVKFFDENLSKYGWTKSSELIGSSAILVYKKGNQLLLIKVEKMITATYIKMMLTCS
ncbi:hypothetical protein [Hydrogenothermus marinus]|uniref:Lipoprotein n=1 Tax=Hydrogenothermus marinus TaxID=133270 RepID=A0A3M0B9G5_9AQUI|nr:hypothetical protein [Hydrogenothermus marinus]RMA93124.1 hypothetical protein CLV39_1455 [Hydrogenothermus marinus]